MKQQSKERHVEPSRHIILILSQPVFSSDSLEALENLTNTIKKDQRKMEVFDENILVVEGASEYYFW
jgi:hypothetical protein